MGDSQYLGYFQNGGSLTIFVEIHRKFEINLKHRKY